MIEDTQASAGHSGSPDGGTVPLSEDWWRGRSFEELKYLIGQGLAGGNDLYGQAAREIERRSQTTTTAEDAERTARTRRISGAGRLAVGGAILFVIVLAAIAILMAAT